MTITLPVEPFHLSAGAHSDPEQGACFMELAALLGGQPFNDAPKCVSPVVRRLGITLNDRLDDERRQQLLPFVLRSLGTADDGRDEERRRLCTEWLLHYALPTLLEKADRKAAADKLRALPGDLAVEGVRRAIRETRDEAWSARNAAVGRLRERIREAMRERADAGAGAAAAAAAAAVAVAAAAAADAAAADADAAAAAAAAVVVAADAGAAAVAAAAAAASPAARRDAVWRAIYDKMRERFALEQLAPELLPSALELLDRMLPKQPLKAPVIENAEIICAAPSAR